MSKFKFCIFAFFLTLIISLIAFMFLTRNNPVLFQKSQAFLIQNPFRDRIREKAAESFLYSLKGLNIEDSLINPKGAIYLHRNGNEIGKLANWNLQSRFDNESESSFHYAIYREDDFKAPKKGKYFLSFVILKVVNENSEWKVKEYNCEGLSWNDW